MKFPPRFWLLVGSLVVTLVAIEGMVWMFREEVQISRSWHFYPLALAGVVVSLEKIWKSDSKSVGREILVSLAWLLMITTPSVIYGHHQLGGESRSHGEAVNLSRSLYGRESDCS